MKDGMHVVDILSLKHDIYRVHLDTRHATLDTRLETWCLHRCSSFLCSGYYPICKGKEIMFCCLYARAFPYMVNA
jgi:hypothetical protein